MNYQPSLLKVFFNDAYAKIDLLINQSVINNFLVKDAPRPNELSALAVIIWIRNNDLRRGGIFFELQNCIFENVITNMAVKSVRKFQAAAHFQIAERRNIHAAVKVDDFVAPIKNRGFRRHLEIFGAVKFDAADNFSRAGFPLQKSFIAGKRFCAVREFDFAGRPTFLSYDVNLSLVRRNRCLETVIVHNHMNVIFQNVVAFENVEVTLPRRNFRFVCETSRRTQNRQQD